MKIIALFSLFAALLAPVAVFAADPVVVVKDASTVTIDGQPAGTVVDALANNPGVPNLRARLLDAWLAHETAFATAERARADAVIKSGQAATDKQIADAKAASDKAIADNAAAQKQLDDANARLAAGAAFIAKLQKQIRGLGAEPVTP